ncbi:MAG: hypothetical protein EAX95_16280 [Candidatus Thorarchaeota archaeon]|nr:hypothetical protein [Candidatus Thorarchaeota archaeon]
MPYDGTRTGVGDPNNSHTTNALSIGSSFVDDNLLTWWVLEFFWPVCHLALTAVAAGLSQVVHFTIDLIGNRELYDLQVDGGPSFDDYLEGASDFLFASIFAMLLQSAVVAINIFDMFTSVPGNQANPYAGVPLGVAIVLTVIAYIAPITIIELEVADGSISHGNAAWDYFSLFIMTLLVLSGWKPLKNVLAATTSALLGFVFGIHLMGAGVWVPWIEETFEPRTKWGSLIVLGASTMFCGLWIYHLVLSLRG